MDPVKVESLCSSCGLCMTDKWSAEEGSQSCVFKTGWLGQKEIDLFGRERSLDDLDEASFGITRQRLVACIKDPVPGAAWTGVITSIAKKAFESGLVEAVMTLHRGESYHFAPVPVLACSTEEILAGSGNKPVLSPVLRSLGEAYEKGIRKLLVVGAGCHIHALRDFQKRFPYLKDMEIFTVGIPCVSNVIQKNLRVVLGLMSDSPDTVRHYEFMQDYTVHLKHENGRIEKLPYFSIPQEITGINIVSKSCMCCFDYMNGLADITVGYLGAPLNMKKLFQWILVRTEKGEMLRDLIQPDLEMGAESTRGDSSKSVKNGAKRIVEQMRPENEMPLKTGRKVPIWAGKILAAILTRVGPSGLSYAHYAVDMHMIRDYYYVKFYHPDKTDILVPKSVYAVLEKYGFEA